MPNTNISMPTNQMNRDQAVDIIFNKIADILQNNSKVKANFNYLWNYKFKYLRGGLDSESYAAEYKDIVTFLRRAFCHNGYTSEWRINDVPDIDTFDDSTLYKLAETASKINANGLIDPLFETMAKYCISLMTANVGVELWVTQNINTDFKGFKFRNATNNNGNNNNWPTGPQWGNYAGSFNFEHFYVELALSDESWHYQGTNKFEIEIRLYNAQASYAAVSQMSTEDVLKQPMSYFIHFGIVDWHELEAEYPACTDDKALHHISDYSNASKGTANLSALKNILITTLTDMENYLLQHKPVVYKINTVLHLNGKTKLDHFTSSAAAEQSINNYIAYANARSDSVFFDRRKHISNVAVVDLILKPALEAIKNNSWQQAPGTYIKTMEINIMTMLPELQKYTKANNLPY